MNYLSGPFPLSPGYQAVREAAAQIDLDQAQFVLRVSGERALDFLNDATPGKLFYLKPFHSQMTVLLDASLKIVDVLQIIYMEDAYLVIGSRQAKEQVLAELNPSDFEVTLEDLSESHSILGLEGPYAWRVMRDAFGSETLGLRIYGAMDISLSDGKSLTCVRSGCSGEYGYRLIFDRSQSATVKATLLRAVDLPTLDLDGLGLVALETRLPLLGSTVQQGDCPFELGLRYLLDFSKEEYRFHSALKAESEQSHPEVVAFLAPETFTTPAAISLGDQVVGSVRVVRRSPKLGQAFGYALLEPKVAFPMVPKSVESAEPGESLEFRCAGFPIQTRSSPLLTTLSKTVSME